MSGSLKYSSAAVYSQTQSLSEAEMTVRPVARPPNRDLRIRARADVCTFADVVAFAPVARHDGARRQDAQNAKREPRQRCSGFTSAVTDSKIL